MRILFKFFIFCIVRGYSSIGRAFALRAKGHWFDSSYLQKRFYSSVGRAYD